MNPTLLSSDQRDNSIIDSACNLPKKSQHAQYAQHFPIPSENLSAHENNQRLILLYGVGKARSQAMATTKEVTKALCAMLNDLGKVDDSDPVQNSEHLKKERDEKRAALYRYMYVISTCIVGYFKNQLRPNKVHVIIFCFINIQHSFYLNGHMLGFYLQT